jgi:hypothetical protein
MTIIFYIVTIIIGILTYKQAKKTIFSPIKTEVFKLQTDVFHKILSFFDEVEYKERFDFDKIVNMNIKLTIDNYLINLSEFKIDKNFLRAKRDIELKEFPISMASIEGLKNSGWSMPCNYIEDTSNKDYIDRKELYNNVNEIRVTMKY